MFKNSKYNIFDLVNLIIYLEIEKQKKKGLPNNLIEYPVHLKIQTLLYFFQVGFLVVKKQKAFNEKIIALKFGPVIDIVYNGLKKYGTKGIEINNKEIKKSLKKIEKEDLEIFEGIYEIFGKFSAGFLIKLIQKHTPWQITIKQGEGTEIRSELLYNFYKELFEVE